MPRGRPIKERETELGRYLTERRSELGWSVADLASRSRVPYRTISKIELGRYPLRRPNILLKLADALDVHANRLLVKAALTPLLVPSTGAQSARTAWTVQVTSEERLLLENYLDFMRYSQVVDQLAN